MKKNWNKDRGGTLISDRRRPSLERSGFLLTSEGEEDSEGVGFPEATDASRTSRALSPKGELNDWDWKDED